MSFLGEALGIDPQAFNRGAENQIKLQQLQRIEQERLDRMKLKSPMIDRTVGIGSAPVFDSSDYASPQVGVVTTPEVTVEKLPPIVTDDATTYKAPEKTDTKKDEVVLQPSADELANAEKEELHVQGMPWKVVDKDGGKVVVHNGIEYQIQDVFGDGSSLQIVDQYGRPNFPLTDAFTRGRVKGITNTELVPIIETTTTTTTTTTGADKKDTKKTTGTEVVTEAQSTNTGNTAKATENVSSLQTSDAEVDQIVKDTNTVLFGTETVNTDGSTAESNSIFNDAIYLANPSKAGQDTKYVLETRKQAARVVERLNQRAAEFARFAEIARLNGNFESYEKYIDLANAAEAKALEARASISQVDQKLLYLQAMQGLNDLKFGNTAKAAMVWSMYSGRDVRIIPRTDGKFNITVDGEYYKTDVTESALVQELRLTFDSNFRDAMNKLAGQKSMKLFEAGIDIQKELQKQQAIMLKEINVEKIKNQASILLETIKQANGEFKAIGDGSGRGTVVLNGTLYLFDPNSVTQGPDGKEIIQPQLKPMTPPAVASGSGNAYVDALNNKGE